MKRVIRIVIAPAGLVMIGVVGVCGLAAFGAVDIAIRLWDRSKN
jgi:hypothetical protein